MTAWNDRGEDDLIRGQNRGGIEITNAVVLEITIAVVFLDIIVMIRGLDVVNLGRIVGGIDSYYLVEYYHFNLSLKRLKYFLI